MDKSERILGKIFSIEEFSVFDGPGVRMTVFLKGCPMRCAWCHNPEGQSFDTQTVRSPNGCIDCGACLEAGKKAVGYPCLTKESIEVCPRNLVRACGQDITGSELVQILLKKEKLLKAGGGGVTFSGGEPLLQPDFLAEVMQKCNAEGIHTAIESAVCVPWESIEKILPYCDHFICDLKHADTEKHREGTGAGNERIIENLSRLAKTGKLFEVRTPIIPDFNDSAEDVKNINNIVKGFGGNIKHTLLPFHNICASKYEAQGRKFEAADVPEPTKDKMNELSSLINGG